MILQAMSYHGKYDQFIKGNEHCVHITNGKDFPEWQHMLQKIYEITNITVDELRWNDVDCGFKLPYICKHKGSLQKKKLNKLLIFLIKFEKFATVPINFRTFNTFLFLLNATTASTAPTEPILSTLSTSAAIGMTYFK